MPNGLHLKLLSIETSSDGCSAALYLDGVVTEQFEIAPRGHGQLILTMVDQLLIDAGLNKSQLDGLGFGCGPGAFTGVRIATSVIQGVAFGLDLPVAAVSSLATLAQGAYRRSKYTHIASVVDARMGEVYWGHYIYDEVRQCMQPCGDERVCPPDALVIDGKVDVPWFGAGSGWQVYREELLAQYIDKLQLFDDQCRPQAQDVALLAVDVFNQGQQLAPEQALPVYLRDNVVRV